MSEEKVGAQSFESTKFGLEDNERLKEKDWCTSVFRRRL